MNNIFGKNRVIIIENSRIFASVIGHVTDLREEKEV